MRVLGFILLLLTAEAFAGSTGGDFFFSTVNMTGSPQKLRSFALYPAVQIGTNSAGQLVTLDSYVTNTGTAGSFVISNVTGGSYYSVLNGTRAVTTNYWIFPSTNAYLSAAPYMKSSSGGYLKANGGGRILWNP